MKVLIDKDLLQLMIAGNFLLIIVLLKIFASNVTILGIPLI